jgi:hypothetical protein
MDFIKGHELAETLALAKSGKSGKLPQLTGISLEEQLKIESRDVRDSFAYARTELSFS